MSETMSDDAKYLDECLRLRGGVSPEPDDDRAVRNVLNELAAARREVETAQAEARLRGETIDALRNELAAEKENNTLIAQAANFNAALAIEELRVEMLGDTLHTAKDGRVRGLCANCLTWHFVGDMWAECRACFDETTGKALREQVETVTREKFAWQQAALNVGEMLGTTGPTGYYEMSAADWRDWALRDLATSRAALEDVRRVDTWVQAQGVVEGVQRSVEFDADSGKWEAQEWPWSLESVPLTRLLYEPSLEALGRALAQEAGDVQ